MMKHLTNLIGERFGKLSVVEELQPVLRPNNRLRRYLKCSCDCGGTKISSWDNLKSGAIDNCGCESPRHGGTGTKLYGVWHRIVQCCTDENYQAYKNYGARGITLCNEWKDFKIFREWAINHGYAAGLSIDRIDNDKGYFPENCKWATTREQNQNKRTNVKIYHEGKLITASEVARLTGTPLSTVLYRHRKTGEQNAIQKPR